MLIYTFCSTPALPVLNNFFKVLSGSLLCSFLSSFTFQSSIFSLSLTTAVHRFLKRFFTLISLQKTEMLTICITTSILLSYLMPAQDTQSWYF